MRPKPAVIVVGGNAAGMTAAGRASRLDPDLEITVLEQGAWVSYSICGTPYYLSGEVPTLEALVSYTPEAFEQRTGVRVRTRVRAEMLDLPRRRVVATDLESGREVAFGYDHLLVATGYRPLGLGVPGEQAGNVFALASFEDAAAIARALDPAPRAALLVGAGLVGLELAEALVRRGIPVTMIEKGSHILPGLDPEIASLVETELARAGVRLWPGRTLRTLFADAAGRVEGAWIEGIAERVPADLVVADVGVRPEVRLAAAAGLALGLSGAIEVTPRLQTSAPGVFAAGNCAETVHRVSNRPVVSAVGTAASKQGRVAGENLAGRRSQFRGVLDTWVVRAFALTVARTGLSELEAAAAGFAPVAATITAQTRSPHLGGAAPLTLRAVGDRRSRRLLGVQGAGAGADKRIDVAAAALSAGMTVDEAAQLDLGYAPPYGQVWDPFLVAMNGLLRHLG